ncbi:translation Initiation factor eIF- 4e [Kipferlia bialata]|uniref:Translation Initiation factor eIF- 4e n=1 Tax=Kipferlia bialata TaxID=797122 RepID=A0A9K3CXA5_9EUKA|nr:translation Initiation factor eIF- 4e [Kipferlia bialata]GIQ84886.1 translation Initiation factor eIF- 4e [Kipferlia bialata]|eukprot:g2686.t1
MSQESCVDVAGSAEAEVTVSETPSDYVAEIQAEIPALEKLGAAIVPVSAPVVEKEATPVTPRESDDLEVDDEGDEDLFDLSQLKLQESWSLSFSTQIPKNKKSKKSQGTSEESWAKNVHKVTSVSSVEEFWCLYHFMDRLVSIGNLAVQYASYHYFKNDIEPKWETEENKNGCTMVIRLHNNKGSDKKFTGIEKVEFKAQFLCVLLGVIGGTSPLHDIVNGIVCKVCNHQATLFGSHI